MEEILDEKIEERVYAYGSGPVTSRFLETGDTEYVACGIDDFKALKNDLRSLGLKGFKMDRAERTLTFRASPGILK